MLEIKGIECKHAVYCPPSLNGEPDLHIIKEVIHYSDGTLEPSIRLEYDVKQKFWVSRKGFRNYNQKKESEKIERLNVFETTRSRMAISIANAIGKPWLRDDMREVLKDPFVYGADILSTAVIKYESQKKYPDLSSKNTVVVLDLETDMVEGHEKAIMGSITMKTKAFVAIAKPFVHGLVCVEDEIRKCADKHIGKHIKERNIDIEILIVEDDIEIYKELLARAHKWRPDFLAIWNVLFDIGKIVDAFHMAGIDPAKYFSDPSVPAEYRFFRLKEGPKVKVTESGKTMPLKPADRWHTVYCPASFYIIDSMCVYKRIRIGEAEKASYALDAILADELKDVRKLKIEEGSQYSGAEWHVFMQKYKKIEYIVYNIFDCICVELLDEKTNDLSIKISLYSGYSDYENFKSEPRRLCDAMWGFLQEELGEVIGSSAAKSEEELEADAKTLSIKGWIVTLPAHRVKQNGLRIIKECPDVISNVRKHVGDKLYVTFSSNRE